MTLRIVLGSAALTAWFAIAEPLLPRGLSGLVWILAAIVVLGWARRSPGTLN